MGPTQITSCPPSPVSQRSSRSPYLLALVWIGFSFAGCAAIGPREKPRLIYSPQDFQETLLERVPGLNRSLAAAPFVVHSTDIEKAEARILEAPRGPARVRALVNALGAKEPEGFGLAYHWLSSSSATKTLESHQGNCVSLASVLVGLGRGLGWRIYYAEARSRKPDTHEYEEITLLADHMVVIVAAKTFQMIIDFTGQVDELYEIEPIDDLTAYAHLINNIAGQHIARVEGHATDNDWQIALGGFVLASQIQPKLGRAWNNRGIALTRLGRFEEAKSAYEEALTLDPNIDATRHNLEIMQIRALGKTTMAREPVSR